MNCYFNCVSGGGGGWKATMADSVVPWIVEPTLVHLCGFRLSWVAMDLLHVWFLGVGRDLGGIVFRRIIKSKWFCPGRNQQKRIDYLNAQLYTWRRAKHKNLSMKKFTKANTCLTGSFPELRCKGSDTANLLLFFLDFVNLVSDRKGLPHDFKALATALWAGVHFTTVLKSCSYFVAESEKDLAAGLLETFINNWLNLAYTHRATCDYRLRPKFHLLLHFLIIFKESDNVRNPWHLSTWMDEDKVKRVMRVHAKTHYTTSPVRVLERSLIEVYQSLMLIC